MTTTERPAFMQTVQCAPWCEDGDGHPRENRREDQWCNSPLLMLPFSLEDGAQAIPVTVVDDGAPRCNVYAKQNHHALPVVVLHIFRDHPTRENLSIDADFKLTPAEAIELATNLISTVEMVAGMKEAGTS